MSEPLDIDAIGLLCPWPVLKAQKALRGMAPGARLRLAATDAVAVIDVPHFCDEHGHRLVETSEAGGVTFYLIEKGAR